MTGRKREGIVYDMPSNDYHAHKSLSATGAKTLVLDSPAQYKWEVIDGNREHKQHFNIGAAVHAEVLGVDDGIDALDFDSWRTNASKEARDESYAAGRTPILVKDLEPIHGMRDAVLMHPLARKLFEREGHAEVSLFSEHMGVPIRCRFDYLPDEGGIVADLKTTGTKASPTAFRRAASEHGYHIARAHYLDVLKRVTGRDAEMLFIVVEKAPPYLVAVHQLNADFARIGEDYSLEARDIYKRCMETGEWPGYPEQINLLEPPMHAVYEHIDRFGENK